VPQAGTPARGLAPGVPGDASGGTGLPGSGAATEVAQEAQGMEVGDRESLGGQGCTRGAQGGCSSR